jgi:NitT/TauT family transport system ATP-binding protein
MSESPTARSTPSGGRATATRGTATRCRTDEVGGPEHPGAETRGRAPALALSGVRRIFAGKRAPFIAVDDVDLTVGQGEFVSIVGPSGCGKSTLLGLIAGLARPDAGSVSVLGTEVTEIRRDVGFLFQRDALLPWRTALQNVALGLRYRGASRRDAATQARDWLAQVGLTGFADNYPHQLSGGMRKRVAVAATLAYEPPIVLMDEPFSALDVQTRMMMENDLLELVRKNRQTVLFVTHDLEEAIGMSDRVVVMGASPGRVIAEHAVDIPRPRDLMDVRTDEVFVATYDLLWQELRVEVLKARETASAPDA